MIFDFDIKGNTILHLDALSRREFGNKIEENPENLENRIQHWVQTDALLLNRFRIEIN